MARGTKVCVACSWLGNAAHKTCRIRQSALCGNPAVNGGIMARGQAEFRLHCVIVDYLRVALPPRILFWHTPNGEARSAATGARLKRMHVVRGMPDLFVFHDGELIAIEIKADKGRLSPEQADVADRLVALGAHYILARSLDDVEIGLRNRGVPLLATAARPVPLVGYAA